MGSEEVEEWLVNGHREGPVSVVSFQVVYCAFVFWEKHLIEYLERSQDRV